MNSAQKFLQFALALALAGLLGACGEDLSNLNGLAQQSELNNSIGIEFTASFSDDQVVSSEMVASESSASAQFLVDLFSNALTGEVNVNPEPNSMVLKVQLWRGFSGQKGAWLFDLDKPDSGSGNSWRVPENYVLDSAQVELMLRGGLYVLVITSNHVAGEIRGQLLRDGQEVIVNPLTAAQVVSGSSDSMEVATSYLSVDLNTGEVHGTVRHTPGLVVDSLAMHSGIAGLDGDPVLPYEPVPGEPYAWRIPDNTVLTVAQLTLLEQAELYLQVTSDSYPEGELRGQFHLSHYSVISSRLSGMTLIPEISTTASGKAFVTRNNIDGSIQAVLRVSGISPANVILFRANNPNSTSNGKLLYALEQEQDYWRLPKGEIFETNNLNGKLLLIVTSEEYPLGEIGSLL